MKRRGLTYRGRKARSGSLFVLPWAIGFLLFTLYPIVLSIALSLNDVSIDSDKGIQLSWRGFAYYYEALRIDTTFLTALGNNVLFICCATPIVLVFSLIIAILLNKNFVGRTVFRVLFFLPVIIMSGSVIQELLGSYTIDFASMSETVYNFLNTLPEIFRKPIFFALENLVLILWYSGVQILLFLAGLQKVNRSLYEAAEIDGAGAWQKFWKITLPHVRPMILLNAIYTVMEIANSANNEVADKIAAHMFEVNRPFSFSAAMSWLYFLAVCGMLLVVFILFRGRDKS